MAGNCRVISSILCHLCNIRARVRSVEGTSLIQDVLRLKSGPGGFGVRSHIFGETMKRIVTVVLLLLLASAAAMPASAQIFMGPNSQKRAQKAAKKEKKTEFKNAKKKQKAMRKYAKREQKAEHHKR